MQDHSANFQRIHKDQRSLRDPTLLGVQYSQFQTRSLRFAQLELALFLRSLILILGRHLIGFFQLVVIELLFSFLTELRAWARSCWSRINLKSLQLLIEGFLVFILSLVFQISHHYLHQMLNPVELIHLLIKLSWDVANLHLPFNLLML